VPTEFEYLALTGQFYLYLAVFSRFCPHSTFDDSVIQPHDGSLPDRSDSMLFPISTAFTLYDTSHASISYCKQLPHQQMVGAIGREWHESTPLKETMRPAQTNPRRTKKPTGRPPGGLEPPDYL